MPTRVDRWACDICRAEYDSEADAARCEAKGSPNPALWPVGLMIGCCLPRDGTVDVYAVASAPGRGHDPDVAWWLARDLHERTHGDILPGAGRHPPRTLLSDARGWSAPDPAWPATRRMVAALRAAGITPTIHDPEGRVVE